MLGLRTVRTMFRAVHRQMGQPTLSIIPPVAAWSLPPGVTHDAHRDVFINAVGAPVTVPWTDQAVVVAAYLPDRATTGFTWGMTGITTEETTNVVLLWSAETEALLRLAWGVVLQGNLYRIKSVDLAPEGVTPAFLLQIALKKGVLDQ